MKTGKANLEASPNFVGDVVPS